MDNPSTKLCIICLEMYDRRKSELIKLSSTSPDDETYMNQMQYALNLDFVFDDSSEICMYCLEDLNKVYQFRKKFDVAVEYWKLYDSKLNTQNADNEDANEECLSEDPVKTEAEIEFAAVFACGRCQQMFSSAAKLVSHQCQKPKSRPYERQTELKEPKVFFCRICYATFDRQSSLKEHRSAMHARKKLDCSTCGRTFSTAFNLSEHEASHSGALNYNCEVCGKLFQRLSSQRRHLRTHRGQKPKTTPFLCTVCGKRFPASNGMQRHLRTHTGERRHSCHVCAKRFVTSTHLKVHLRTHTGERPYACPVCRAAFTLPATLRKHLRVHERGGGDV